MIVYISTVSIKGIPLAQLVKATLIIDDDLSAKHFVPPIFSSVLYRLGAVYFILIFEED